MKASPDYYAESRGIATSLFERGEFDWSRKIEDAISGGATGTEIMTRLRCTLRQLLESNVLTAKEGDRIQAVVDELDAVLR